LEVKLQAFITSALDGIEWSARYKNPVSEGLMSVTLIEGCKNLGRPFDMTNKFYITVPNICRSAVWKLLHATVLATRILK